jgi:hypothetical protein
MDRDVEDGVEEQPSKADKRAVDDLAIVHFEIYGVCLRSQLVLNGP